MNDTLPNLLNTRYVTLEVAAVVQHTLQLILDRINHLRRFNDLPLNVRVNAPVSVPIESAFLVSDRVFHLHASDKFEVLFQLGH